MPHNVFTAKGRVDAQVRRSGLSPALLATMNPRFTRRPARNQDRVATWSTLDVLAEMKRLGWCVLGPDAGTATACYRNDALIHPAWLAAMRANGPEPGLALVSRRERRHLVSTLQLSLRLPTYDTRWVVGPAASPIITLMQGEPLVPQLTAAIAALESAWTALAAALPAWFAEAIPAREWAGVRELLNTKRPLPPARPAVLSPWHPQRRRFFAPGRFVDRPSPYALPEPPAPVSLGLPGDWNPLGSRWACYEQAVREYVFGGLDPITGRKRPRLPDSLRRLALLQAIWGLILGDPSLASATAPSH